MKCHPMLSPQLWNYGRQCGSICMLYIIFHDRPEEAFEVDDRCVAEIQHTSEALSIVYSHLYLSLS